MNLTCRLSGDTVPATDRSESIDLPIAPLACLFILPLYASSAWAEPVPTELPGGAQVSTGQASIDINASRMDVNQTSQNVGINWQTFNIGSNAQVDFHQPNAAAIAVNRIADTNGSQIMGKLNANGQVYLINPNGVLFGQGSEVNVGGLVASTLDTGNDPAGDRRTFTSAGGNGKIVNQGTLNADGGYIALLGKQVSNQGVIQAKLGTVALAAGDKITLEFSGDKLLNVEVDKGALQTLAENKQLIQADGGTVLMTAKAADALLSGVVNNEGVIEARSVENHNGVIKLLGDMDSGTVNVGGTLDASAPESGNGGFIETSAHNVLLNTPAVTASAPYGKGGTWLIDPTDITIDAGAATTYSTTLNGGTDVTVSTVAAGAEDGNLTVASSIAKTAGGAATLTLQAHNNIIVNAGVSISSTSDALNVVLNSDADASGAGNIRMGSGSSITSNGGSITLGGGADPLITAATGSGAGVDLYGIYLNNVALNAGAGNISLTGTGKAGTSSASGIYAIGGTSATTTSGNITLNGTGGAGTDLNSGVYLFGAGTNISSATGAISITGLGAGTGTGISNIGIIISNGATVTSTGTATITLDGTAGAGTNSNVGVYLSSAGTNISSTTGAISITGRGAGSGSLNHGIIKSNGAAVTSTGSANITLDGRGAGTALGINTGSGTIGGASDTGNITLIADSASGADSLSLADLTLQSTGNLLLQPLNAATTIGLAGGAGAFNLDATELGLIQNGFANITIGRADGTGAITTGAWTSPASANLTLQNTGAGSSGIAINGALTWGAGKNLTLNSTGDIALSAPISWTSGTLAINTSSTITDTAAISGTGTAIFDLQAGTWSQIAASLPAFAVHDFRISGGSFIRALSGDGTVGTPYQLADIYGVQGMGSSGMLGLNYALANDVDATGTANWWAGAGFNPVGNNIAKFTGNFDGQGHTITGLTINRLATNYVGLFGWATGDLYSVGLLNSSIGGQMVTGSLAGRSDGAVSYSYADGGSVTGDLNVAGGLIGQVAGSVDYSYASVNVTANSNGGSSTAIGGLVGLALNGSNIRNSYATGSVHGGDDVGGLVGQVYGTVTNGYSTGAVTWTTSGGGLIGFKSIGGTVSNSYWDKTVTPTDNGLGTGKTTAEMKQLTTFSSWDIDDAGGTGKIWRIYENNTYPLLRNFMTALTVTANNASKTYDGLAYSGGNGVSYSTAPNANLLGSASYTGSAQGAVNAGAYAITPAGFYSNQRGYDIGFANGTLTINPASVVAVPTATVTGSLTGTVSKVYDGTITAQLTPENFLLSGFLGSDGAIVTQTNGAYASPNVGSGIPVTVDLTPSHYKATGSTNLGNYLLPTHISAAIGVITASPLTVEPDVSQAPVTGNLSGTVSKVYDGTATALLTPANFLLTGFIGSDGATVTKTTGTYASADVGNGIPVTATLTPADYKALGTTNLDNYSLPASMSGNIGSIVKAPLGIVANDADKIYDGLAFRGGNGVSYSGFVNGENADVLGGKLVYGGDSQGAINGGSYALTPSGLTAANYALTFTDGRLAVNALDSYNPANNQLTIPTIAVAGKVYNDVVVSVAEVLDYTTGGSLANANNSYDPVTNVLTIPSVVVGGVTYTNVRVAVGNVLSYLTGNPNVNSYYNPASNQLTIPAITVGGKVYNDVVVSVAEVLGYTTGGSPATANNSYDPVTNILTIPSVVVGGVTYTNVRVLVGNVLRYVAN